MIRRITAITLITLSSLYTVLVLAGKIPESQRITATHLVLLAITGFLAVMLLAPKSLQRLKILELSGFKLELLERVRENQLKQSEAIDTIDMILPVLLPEPEQAHLVNLLNGTANNYKGGGALRSELRRLRSGRLIEMTGKGYVGELTSDKRFDLAQYVRLTNLGRRWATQVASIAKQDNADPEVSEVQSSLAS